jgi:hypothetical protein
VVAEIDVLTFLSAKRDIQLNFIPFSLIILANQFPAIYIYFILQFLSKLDVVQLLVISSQIFNIYYLYLSLFFARVCVSYNFVNFTILKALFSIKTSVFCYVPQCSLIDMNWIFVDILLLTSLV